MEFESLIKEIGADTETAERLREALRKADQEDRERRRQLQTQGIAAAKARNIPIGRPKTQLRNFDRLYPLQREGLITVTDLAHLCGVSRCTIYRRLREYDKQSRPSGEEAASD